MGGSIKKAQVGHVIISVAKTLQQQELLILMQRVSVLTFSRKQETTK